MEALGAFVPLVIKIGIDPQITKIGGLEISWHGVFTAVGVICGVAVAAFFGRRAGFGEDTIYNTALALVVGGTIGARTLYVLENLDQFQDDPLDVFAINGPASSCRDGRRPGPSGGVWAAHDMNIASGRI